MKFVCYLLPLLALACSNSNPAPAADAPAATATTVSGGPFLTMKVDGKPVVCSNIFGAYNPQGYPKGTTIVAGDIKTDRSQPFNIALYDIQETGTYTITNKSDPVKWAVQCVNPESTDPFDIRLLAVNNPDGEIFTIRFTKLGEFDVEGTFEGTLTSDNGKTVMRITEGKFDTE